MIKRKAKKTKVTMMTTITGKVQIIAKMMMMMKIAKRKTNLCLISRKI